MFCKVTFIVEITDDKLKKDGIDSHSDLDHSIISIVSDALNGRKGHSVIYKIISKEQFEDIYKVFSNDGSI